MEELEIWYKQIENCEQLTIKEAKKILLKARNTNDRKEELEYINRVILGTLYVVYNYIEKHQSIMFFNRSYDIDDIINSFCEEWIKKIKSYDILKVESYSAIITTSFLNRVQKHIIPDRLTIYEQFGITEIDFQNVLMIYIQLRNRGLDVDFDRLKEAFLTEYRGYYKYLFDKLNCCEYLVVLFDKIYNQLQENEIDKIELDRIKDEIYLLINSALIETLTADIIDFHNYEEEILEEEFLKDFMSAIYSVNLTDYQKSIILERFGFLTGEPKTKIQLSKMHGVSKQCIGQMESIALQKLRDNPKIKKIYMER